MPSLSKSIALLPALFSSLAFAVRPVEVRGQEFVDVETNKRLMIVGVDYQPGGQAGYEPIEGSDLKKDVLIDKKTCLRDAALMQKLGVNTIRVYNIDPKQNHDECMSIFNAAGIYLMLDVNSPFSGESINRAEPWTSYHEGYLERVFQVVENFKNYPNTLAFFSANEVMNDLETAEFNPQYIRSVQRDLKNYIKNHSDRPIPVGYSAADVREILEDTWAYFECAIDGKEDDMSRSDFFGLNSYSWCGGDATFETAGYNEIVNFFKDSTHPVFFSEYGCNEVKPRVFNEVEALYGKKMTALSGGLIYEYSQEEADYGLVDINENGTISLRIDFENLQAQYNKLDLTLLETADSKATSMKPRKCDKSLINDSRFSKNFTLLEVPEGVEDMIKNGVKGAYSGKLVSVNDVKSPYSVYTTSGAEIKDLAIEKVENNDSNVPGGHETNAGGDGGDGEGATGNDEKKKGSASTLSVNGGCGALLVTVFLAVLTYL